MYVQSSLPNESSAQELAPLILSVGRGHRHRVSRFDIKLHDPSSIVRGNSRSLMADWLFSQPNDSQHDF